MIVLFLFPLGLMFGIAVLIALGVVFGARVAALAVLIPTALAVLAGAFVLVSFLSWVRSF